MPAPPFLAPPLGALFGTSLFSSFLLNNLQLLQDCLGVCIFPRPIPFPYPPSHLFSSHGPFFVSLSLFNPVTQRPDFFCPLLPLGFFCFDSFFGHDPALFRGNCPRLSSFPSSLVSARIYAAQMTHFTSLSLRIHSVSFLPRQIGFRPLQVSPVMCLFLPLLIVLVFPPSQETSLLVPTLDL